jgi:hypothetical protein
MLGLSCVPCPFHPIPGTQHAQDSVYFKQDSKKQAQRVLPGRRTAGTDHHVGIFVLTIHALLAEPDMLTDTSLRLASGSSAT